MHPDRISVQKRDCASANFAYKRTSSHNGFYGELVSSTFWLRKKNMS